ISIFMRASVGRAKRKGRPKAARGRFGPGQCCGSAILGCDSPYERAVTARIAAKRCRIETVLLDFMFTPSCFQGRNIAPAHGTVVTASPRNLRRMRPTL